MHPVVSVIIPVYNVEPYLDECMQSIIRQTYPHLEIICINDGSTDNSLEILKKYEALDPRVKVFSFENGGYGRAMNLGLDRATGKYVAIVEPDDFIHLTMYEDLVELAENNNLDFVKADFFRFTRANNGNMRLKYNHLDKTDSHYNKVFNPSQAPDTLLFIMNTWSGIYLREFIEKHGIRHHESPGASFQDNGFWFQTFAYARRAMIVNKPYYMNRRDNPGSSVKDPHKVYCMNEEYDYIENLLRPQEELWKTFKYMFWLKRFDNYIGTLKRIDPSYHAEYLQRFQADFQRADELGELSENVFPETKWNDLKTIMDNPSGYARKLQQKANAKTPSKSLARRVAGKIKRLLTSRS